jgi:hypothetical protein
LIFVPGARDVEPAEATAIFGDIRAAIDTGADDIPILLSYSRGQPAWAGAMAVPPLILEQPGQDLQYHLLVLIELKPLRLGVPGQDGIEFFWGH